MRSVNALAVVNVLILVVMALGAGLKRGIHRIEAFASMFLVTRDAGEARFTMCSNNGRRKSLGMMTGSAVRTHLVLVCHTHSKSMAGGAGSSISLFRNRRH